MRLLLVRHAIAVPRGTPGVRDTVRPLAARGRRRFKRAARGLAALLPRPDLLLSSPIRRARQTAEMLAHAWDGATVALEPSLARDDRAAVMAVLARHVDKRLVALVGHDPYLSELLAWLVGARRAEALPFRKGGAALLDLPERGSSAGATLVAVLPPRVLRRLAR